MNDQQQALSGQQVKAMQERMQESLQRLIDQMNLRKWSVEQATKMPPVDDPLILAKNIYDFVTAPVADVRVTIE